MTDRLRLTTKIGMRALAREGANISNIRPYLIRFHLIRRSVFTGFCENKPLKSWFEVKIVKLWCLIFICLIFWFNCFCLASAASTEVVTRSMRSNWESCSSLMSSARDLRLARVLLWWIKETHCKYLLRNYYETVTKMCSLDFTTTDDRILQIIVLLRGSLLRFKVQ